MDLQLAVVLSSTSTGCQVQLEGSPMPIDAIYSAAMLENAIAVSPGELVAVGVAAVPLRIVFRWCCYTVSQVEGRFALSENGRPVSPDHVRAGFFPRIEAIYRGREALETQDPKQIVERAYDCIAERYTAWAQSDPAEARKRYTSLLLASLPPGAEVLDLGCGAGVPATLALAQHCQVTGVDISARQIALARQNVPEAVFIHADMAQLTFPPASFDAAVAFYSLIHVPREEQRQLWPRVASWLRPGGLLVATLGTSSMQADYDENWLGAPMYWSGFDPQTNKQIIEEAGLHIIGAREETVEEHGQPAKFFWVVAKKPDPSQ